MSRRGSTSIVASPVLVGAVTVLVAIISVFLAYNANQGLPFVPTYDVKARIPGGANLVVGNDVRAGGFRVGLVERIRPAVESSGEAVAVVDLKLDKSIEPLPLDTKVLVRPRSALGLKYVELTLGRSKRSYAAGATIPIKQAGKPIELDEFFGTFDEEFRDNQRTALEGFGTALSGRGLSINESIENFVPFFRHLEPVFRALSDRDTRLERFVVQARRFAGQVAPVATTYADLFSNMATTFEALSRHPERLRQTVEKSPQTLQQGIQSLPVQRPFLADAEILFRRLRPVAEEFDRSLPRLASALEVGAPVLAKAPPFYDRTRGVLAALRDLARNPSTLLALRDIDTALTTAGPLVEFIAPYQTVCNYWNYYWTALGEHISEPVRGGTIQRVLLRADSNDQDDRLSDSTADRPVDVPANEDPVGAENPGGQPYETLHSQAYGPAIDAQGNADCQTGQRGYLNRLLTGGRYPRSNSELGGNHLVLDSDTPGLAGPTYTGVPNLKDVP